MLDQVLYKWIRITVNKHCIRSVSHILLHVRVHLCARLKLFAPGLVAQSCNSATGGQELWDGWRLLWPQTSGRKYFCDRTEVALLGKGSQRTSSNDEKIGLAERSNPSSNLRQHSQTQFAPKLIGAWRRIPNSWGPERCEFSECGESNRRAQHAHKLQQPASWSRGGF